MALTDKKFDAWVKRASQRVSETELKLLERVSRERFAIWNSDNPAVHALLAKHSRAADV